MKELESKLAVKNGGEGISEMNIFARHQISTLPQRIKSVKQRTSTPPKECNVNKKSGIFPPKSKYYTEIMSYLIFE